MVNQWCVILAAYWLSIRRGNPPPGSFDDLCKATLADLEKIHSGQFDVAGIGEREAGWPAWSNVRVDILYPLRKIRVERPISEKQPTTYQQAKDWPAEFITDL